jgi:hypothetical protein
MAGADVLGFTSFSPTYGVVDELEFMAQEEHICWPMHDPEPASADLPACRACAESEVAPQRNS